MRSVQSSRLSGELRVGLGRPWETPLEPQSWLLKTFLPDGQPWMWAAGQRDGYLLRYCGLADFLVDRGGAEIKLSSAGAATSSNTLRHLVLDQTIPMVLSLRGIPALHASAVVTPNGVCAFLGATGAGKSTLAASFSAAGYPVLSDDCLAFREADKFYAVPAYPGFRLWTDSAQWLSTGWFDAPTVAHYTRKRRILNGCGAERFPGRLEPLSAIYSLVREIDQNGGSESLASRSNRWLPPKPFCNCSRPVHSGYHGTLAGYPQYSLY